MAIGGGVHVGVCSGGVSELEDVKGTYVHNVGVWVSCDSCDRCVCVGAKRSSRSNGSIGGWSGVMVV